MEVPQEDNNIQDLQNKVDKIKTINLLNQQSKLTPPAQRIEEDHNQVAIIKGLAVTPRLQDIFLEARGLFFDKQQNQLIQISRPYMNVHGAWRLVNICRHIAQEAEWSNFSEDNIPSYVDHFYKENLPYFTFWYEEYELDPADFNFVMTTLKMFILASFYKAKGGKYINVLSRTYSEDFLGRVMQNDTQKKKEGFLDKYNPFKKVI